jgi:hypothetical protein
MGVHHQGLSRWNATEPTANASKISATCIVGRLGRRLRVFAASGLTIVLPLQKDALPEIVCLAAPLPTIEIGLGFRRSSLAELIIPSEQAGSRMLRRSDARSFVDDYG